MADLSDSSAEESAATVSKKRKLTTSERTASPEGAEVIKRSKPPDDFDHDSNDNIIAESLSENPKTDDAEIGTKKSLTAEEVKTGIVTILNDWKKPSTHAVGRLDESIPPPNLVIDRFGLLPLPVTGLIAGELVKCLERSPFGHGEKTIMDTHVRNSYQIGPEKFTIKNQKFTNAVNEIVEIVAEQFFFSPSNVSAKLYKFLFYETGGLFKPHKDTEKENGMFATLIIQLPSVFTGGQFRVEHNGKTKKFELSKEGSDVSSFYVAHFASCTHELRRIESGYRVALVYNLCWTDDSATIPIAPSYDRVVAAKVRQLITAHLKETMKVRYPGSGLRLVWLLEHNYTDKALKSHGHKALKGKDAFVFKQLLDTNKGQKDKDLFKIVLAEAAKYDSGDCQTHNYGHGHGECSIESGCETEKGLKNFICLSERKPEAESACLFKRLDIEPENDVVNVRGDRAFWGKSTIGKCEGYTGNEGAPMSRWYSRRVLIVYFKADERKISFLEHADSEVRKLREGIERQKLTDYEKECVLTCMPVCGTDDVAALAYENGDLDFVKQVIMKISETDEGFGSGHRRDGGEEDEDHGYESRVGGSFVGKKKNLTRCLKLYKSERNIDDLEPYLVRMIRVIGEQKDADCAEDDDDSDNDFNQAWSLVYDWEKADECLRIVDEILPIKIVYGSAIFELFFELLTHYYGHYRKKKSCYEKALKFLITKYPEIIAAKWETMLKSSRICHPAEAVVLVPVFLNSNLEMADQIVERIICGVLEFVLPKWIKEQTLECTSGTYHTGVGTFENQVQKLTKTVATDNERFMQILCNKFSSNVGLDCVGNWIDWVLGQNIPQLMIFPDFKSIVENRVKTLKLQYAEPIGFIDRRTKQGKERILKRHKLISSINKLEEKLKSMG